uniref:Uncharacterized protein n=1 Tax=Ciona intestinalis TaxID=7719 RepID=H2XMK5_CIOIN
MWMQDISRKIIDRQDKIYIWGTMSTRQSQLHEPEEPLSKSITKHVKPLFKCLDKISELNFDN